MYLTLSMISCPTFGQNDDVRTRTRVLIGQQCQSTIRPSIVKSHLNPFLEPTSTISNEGKVFCSIKQLTPDRSRVRQATHCATVFAECAKLTKTESYTHCHLNVSMYETQSGNIIKLI